MERVKSALKQLAWSTDGQDLLEYGLLACLIAVVVMAGVAAVGNTVFDLFWSNIGQAV